MIMTALTQLFGAWHHERGPAETVAEAYAGALQDTSGNELDDSSQFRGRIDDRVGQVQAGENAVKMQ
jgi:hypothetical protein